MSRVHFLASLVILALAAGCKAQTTPTTPTDAALTRRIEVMVRSKFNVPPDYNVLLGQRKPSQIPGYDTLPVMLSRNGKTTNIDFLISSDNSKLARLETFDLVKDPSLNIDVANRPIRGNPDAKVTIINFDDLECGYCARMHQTFFPATVEPLQGTAQVRVQGFPPGGDPSLGGARRGGCQLSCRAERRRLLELRGLPALAWRGDQRHRRRPRCEEEF